MEKVDLAKTYKSYYTAKPKPEIVNIEPAQYLSITGKGDPSGEAFAERVQALYTTAYTLKFLFKAQGKDYTVPKLEGLWWFEKERYAHLTIVESPTQVPRAEWQYRLLLRLPDFVRAKDVEGAKETAVHKKGLALAAQTEFYQMEEGTCVQMLHTGPFATEPQSLLLIQQFVEEHHLAANGLHHEIYLSDFRKTPQERLKTILREPVK
jgi:hypothetical protein